MFSRNRSKYLQVVKVGGSSMIGRHKGLISLKTGAGFWGRVRGFFSNLAKKAIPAVKNLAKSAIASGKVQEFAKDIINKGAAEVGQQLNKVIGPDPKRDLLIGNVGKALGDKATSAGTKLALDLLGKGIGKPKRDIDHSRKTIDDSIAELLKKGSGLHKL